MTGVSYVWNNLENNSSWPMCEEKLDGNIITSRDFAEWGQLTDNSGCQPITLKFFSTLGFKRLVAIFHYKATHNMAALRLAV